MWLASWVVLSCGVICNFYCWYHPNNEPTWGSRAAEEWRMRLRNKVGIRGLMPFAGKSPDPNPCNTLATWCKELTHWKRPWCWERLRAGGEGDNRGWDGWMASPTQWTWVWVDSGSWWWTERPGVLWFMGWQRVEHDWATELNWTNPCMPFIVNFYFLVRALEISVLYNLRLGIKIHSAQPSMSNLQAFHDFV